MSKVICHVSISLDGFVAGPNQGLDNPLGEGGESLHEWMFETAAWRRMQGESGGSEGADSDFVGEIGSNAAVGAHIMGRNMFGGGPGAWDLDWKGWWGDNPPYHHAVYVLSHHPRPPLAMQGGTTFYFVTSGIDFALQLANEAAGEKDVQIGGGAQTVQQFLRAGYLDELNLHLVPVILGSGERLLEGLGGLKLTVKRVIYSPAVTHLTYRVER